MRERNSRGMAGRTAAAWLVAATCAAGPACATPDDGAGTAQRPIVGGSPETGYPGVGALVVDYGSAFGQYCSGTLIAPQWVLTAAHCVSGSEVPAAYQASFCLGSQALARSDCSLGLYEADSIFPNPSYNSATETGDIGLVHLARAVTGVATYTPNTTALGSSYVGTSIFWVGYGENDGVSDTGNGIKRSGTGTVSSIRTGQIRYDFHGVLPCSGDSGGPEFMTIGGSQRIAGVVAAGDVDCTSYGIDTRVDSWTSWINSTIAGGGGHTNCEALGGSCGAQTCWLVDTAWWACIPNGGRGEGASCNPDSSTWGDTLPCADGLICMETATGATTGRCVRFCRGDGDCSGGDRCELPILVGDATVGACMPTCDLLGGDCGSGAACYQASGAWTACRGSNGLGVGATCDPAIGSTGNVPCADGLSCVRTSGLHIGVCSPYCRDDAGCSAVQMCHIPVFRDIPDVGACTCADRDLDGWCLPDDCNDADVNVNPGHAELCGNGVDDDCDGSTDEGCSGTDADGDGYPAPADCNDADASVHPGATEVCGNGIDDNCDGSTDEGCGCADVDGDGYCPPADCDDTDAAVHPGQPDVCGDGIDNNCNGTIDETCTCDDADGDGWCAADDCDDADPAAHPGAAEACGMWLDLNCNGLYGTDDPECAASGTNGCGCAAPGTPSGGAGFAALLFGAVALLGGARRAGRRTGRRH